MKYRYLPTALVLMLISATPLAETVKTSIDVEADVSTSVRVFVEGKDVTNSVITLKLADKNGFMESATPVFQFVGNASSVSLSLREPAAGGIISEHNDIMKLNTAWIRVDGTHVAANYPLNNQKVYKTLQDIDDPSKGVRVHFASSSRTETYPLGTYRGTYEVIVTPSV
ncbi:hypothetical protein ACS91J_01740 [Pectobacterium carotovorum]|uniref:hypothetical protein n=1 Tax=Pectobacterium odoriferum TaxID=78398 RepID=UPI0013746E02|nr:hypothetical protein [Pectobacterium odoriferum]QHP78717.1 hypothetical protein EO763_01370 [Pectobacterium odoriferum]GKW04279.1 hypothetical protein PEC301877_30920 [Pectobacterium carotovorum subsp. carotovorum]GKX42454.1 hypothetical protein SOASR015_14880 [Pectobacterium carotovorum subsp. carotovorum]GLX55366.1 hypothetical protein Pcaca02_06750 [Pectobacterium carotovorum subsp. carotovorum]